MTYTIDLIDETKNHVTFTVTFDDASTYTERKGDLPLDSEQSLSDALKAYCVELSDAHNAEIAKQSAVSTFKSKVIGKVVTVADDATVS